jgi:hypothetical protein
MGENGDHNIGLQEKRQFFRRKWDENGDHSIGLQEKRQFFRRKVGGKIVVITLAYKKNAYFFAENRDYNIDARSARRTLATTKMSLGHNKHCAQSPKQTGLPDGIF